MPTFDPERLRRELRVAQREIVQTERRLAADSNLISFKAVKGRRAVREAQSAVKEMIALLNANPGRGMKFGLAREIWAAEIRVNQARDALRAIEPDSAE
jgi:hypothetical protein